MGLFIAILGMIMASLFQNGALLFCSLVCFGESLETQAFTVSSSLAFKHRSSSSTYYFKNLYMEQFMKFISILLFIMFFVFTPFYFQKPVTNIAFQMFILLVMIFVYKDKPLCVGTIVFSLITYVDRLELVTSITFLFLIVYMMWRYLVLFMDAMLTVKEIPIPEEFIEQIEFLILSMDIVEDVYSVSIKDDQITIKLDYSSYYPNNNTRVIDAVLSTASEFGLPYFSVFIN